MAAYTNRTLDGIGGGFIGQQATKADGPIARTTILTEFDAAEHTLNELKDLIAQLAQRITPILRPPSPQPSGQGVENTPMRSGLSGRLSNHCSELRGMVNVLSELNALVDL